MSSIDKFRSALKIHTNNDGSAVIVKSSGGYYLLTAAHAVCLNETRDVTLTDVNGVMSYFHNSESISRDDVCVMKLPDDIGNVLDAGIKCATFEGSGYQCEIDGYPDNAPDHKLRVESNCTIDKSSEAGDSVLINWNETKNYDVKMVDLESGFSGSGVFVDSLGEKYLVGIVCSVDDTRKQFLGWKMQKINEILRMNDWQELPLVPIELREKVLSQYEALIGKSRDVLDRINDCIVGTFKLPRQSYKDKITEAICRDNDKGVANVVIVSGEAGVGKSALVKDALKDMSVASVAMLGDDLDKSAVRDILSGLNISDSLEDLYKSPVWGEARKVILVESAERMLNGNTNIAIKFIDRIRRVHSDVTFVFTVRQNAVAMLRMNLRSNGIEIIRDNMIEIGHLNESELMEVGENFDFLVPYIATKQSRDIISIPFYLNLICSLDDKERASLDDDRLKDELCKYVVQGKYDDEQVAESRVACLIKVARLSADNGMELVLCDSSTASESLENDDILVGDIEHGRVRPSHDLLTDWAIGKYIENQYSSWQNGNLTLKSFYAGLDRNVASRNVFKSFVKNKIEKGANDIYSFVKGSLSLKLDDFVYDDLFYAFLDSENGADFLTSIKDVLMNDEWNVIKRIGKALFYMFRDINFDGMRFIKERETSPNVKYRNSQFIVPVGRGWLTFVQFIHSNRNIYYQCRNEFLPLLLECELVKMDNELAEKLQKLVFEILADDLDCWLCDKVQSKHVNDVLRLLFKWIKCDIPRIRKIAKSSLTKPSYRYDVIRRFILLENKIYVTGFIYLCTDVYEKIIQKEFKDDEGIVKDYDGIHVASALSTSYYIFLQARPNEAVKLLCELLNYDIDRRRKHKNSGIETVEALVDGKTVVVYGNDEVWREYRGTTSVCYVKTSLLMAFEKWMLGSIHNNINKAEYALCQENILAFYDYVYIMLLYGLSLRVWLRVIHTL